MGWGVEWSGVEWSGVEWSGGVKSSREERKERSPDTNMTFVIRARALAYHCPLQTGQERVLVGMLGVEAGSYCLASGVE